MATEIAAVQQTGISHCVLIDLDLAGNVYYISSAYQPIQFDGNTYTELGAFLQVSELREDLKSTNGDIAISLSGVPSEAAYVDTVLSAPIRGGTVRIRRAFFDENSGQLLQDSSNVVQVFDRYQGIITNFSVDEQTNFITGNFSNQITVTCSSLQTLLDNRITGQRTNGTDRRRYYPGSIDFDRVKVIQNTRFDFGKAYTPGPGYGGGSPRDSFDPPTFEDPR